MCFFKFFKFLVGHDYVLFSENRLKPLFLSLSTIQVVRSLLVSLAHNETYYSIFNDFIADHPSILEDEGFHFMKHCMRLLSFQNKQTWFKQKLKVLRYVSY